MFHMRRDLDKFEPDKPMPFGYRIEQWYEPMLPAYAAVLAASFASSPELQIYPRLSSKEGCIELMKELSTMPNFFSGASWLILYYKEPAAAIISSRGANHGDGRIETIAVTPRHREVEVGSQLLSKALWAFKDHHFKRVEFRIDRANREVIRFFRRAGFYVESSETYL